MRNLEEVQSLLDKYWSGETTLGEERALKAYFSGPVDERFRRFLPLFQTLHQEQSVRLERDKVVPMVGRRSTRSTWALAASVVTLLGIGAWWLSRPVVHPDAVAEAPVTAPAISTPVPAVTPLPVPTVAIVAQNVPVRRHAVKTYKAPAPPIDAATEQAMEEIKAALSLVSSKLNKGKKAALKDLNQLENMDKFLKPKSDS